MRYLRRQGQWEALRSPQVISNYLEFFFHFSYNNYLIAAKAVKDFLKEQSEKTSHIIVEILKYALSTNVSEIDANTADTTNVLIPVYLLAFKVFFK